METQTRFDLNASIANWQLELAQQPDLTPVVRHELETHLRDTVVELQSRGLNNEESFWLARRRVGRPKQLAEEFAKSNPAEVWRDRVLWIVGALLVVALWNSIVVNLLGNPLMMVVNAFRGGVLMTNATSWLAQWLPLAVAAVFLAKRGLRPARASRFRFLGSRLGTATIVVLFILAANSGRIVSLWEALTDRALNGVDWDNLWSMLFYAIVWPSILLALTLWLMPRERRQPPVSKLA